MTCQPRAHWAARTLGSRVSGRGARGCAHLNHRGPVSISPYRTRAPEPYSLQRTPAVSPVAREECVRETGQGSPRGSTLICCRPLPPSGPMTVRADLGRSPWLSATVRVRRRGTPPLRGQAPSFAEPRCRPRSVMRRRVVESLLRIWRIGASGGEGGMHIAWPRPAVVEPLACWTPSQLPDSEKRF